MEKKLERCLAFLDTLSVVEEGGNIKTKVYRKDTHTDQYLNFESNHPLEHMRGIVRTLFHHAESVVSNELDRQKELEHIRSALSLNGYPDWRLGESREVKETEEPEVTSQVKEKEKKKRFLVVIPYVKGLAEEVRRGLSGYGVPLYFKPTNTLRQMLVRPKQQVQKDKMVAPVYRIECNSCQASYVGETERSLKARFMEHRRPSTTTTFAW